jgi:hypothetical protein
LKEKEMYTSAWGIDIDKVYKLDMFWPIV